MILLLELALKLSFAMNSSTSLKSSHVILCKSQYSRPSFSGTFLFINLPAFNNAAHDFAKTDGGASTSLASVTFEIIATGFEKLPGVNETNSLGEDAVCSLFSKTHTRGALKSYPNIARASGETIMSSTCYFRIL